MTPSVSAMRNRLVHAYFAINKGIVWQSVEEPPSPIAALEAVLKE